MGGFLDLVLLKSFELNLKFLLRSKLEQMESFLADDSWEGWYPELKSLALRTGVSGSYCWGRE